MQKRKRRHYTQAEKSLMWDRWQNGESMNEIGRSFGIQGHSSIQNIFSETGGIRPATRRRSSRSLSLSEREEISRGVVAGRSLRAIARDLDRAPSTVSREIRRNRGRRSYRAHKADTAAWERAKRPKPCKLAQNGALARIVANKLLLEWAPEQIAGWVKRAYPDDEAFQVSHETIYKSLYIQTRGALKKGLLAYLRRPRSVRRSRHHTQKGPEHGQIVDAVPIRERPAEVEDRAVPGHWEGDLLCGTKDSQIITLVERQTRYVMLVRASRKDTATVVKALTRHAQKLPRELYKSLTWDRGSEMAGHKTFSMATDIKVYFCDPQQPWQRGSNENTNALLRQYFPKGMDLSNVHQNRLNAVAKRLNERPRKTLGYYSPAEKFYECVASTD
ncbi:MAG: IS30 family transposase [Gammaproteobacteria bacterium]|nr:IS30 family transposase [Gammaproteobacteria bacterium]MDH5303932.1 IS30 family transposase [Gammaproteobacteria bacterium]MDH5321089.1 IS30 family transposase [Gammaproteobacteria bacterium]